MHAAARLVTGEGPTAQGTMGRAFRTASAPPAASWTTSSKFRFSGASSAISPAAARGEGDEQLPRQPDAPVRSQTDSNEKHADTTMHHTGGGQLHPFSLPVGMVHAPGTRCRRRLCPSAVTTLYDGERVVSANGEGELASSLACPGGEGERVRAANRRSQAESRTETLQSSVHLILRGGAARVACGSFGTAQSMSAGVGPEGGSSGVFGRLSSYWRGNDSGERQGQSCAAGAATPQTSSLPSWDVAPWATPCCYGGVRTLSAGLSFD